MAKLRPGIEYPIIPEDLIASEEESLQFNEGQSYPGISPCYPDGIMLDDWMILEQIMHQCSEA
jgi:hypothetical protein